MTVRAPIVVSVAAVAIGLVGCAGGDGTTPSTTSQTTRPPAATATTVTTTIPVPTAPSYGAPIDLGVLPGTVMSSAEEINNDGVIVGRGFTHPPAPNGPSDVAVWWPTPTGGPQRIKGDPAGRQGDPSEALRINDRGQILVSTSSHTFVIDPTAGTSTEVIVPFASTPMHLLEAGMNNHGDVVGGVIVRMVHDAEGEHAVGHAFRWTFATRKAIDLGTLPGAESSGAKAINDAGQIVGESGGWPFYWDPKTRVMRALDTREGGAFTVNDRGQAAGAVGGRAWVWNLNTGAATELGVEVQGRASAVDINNFGQVLGRSYTDGSWATWVWDPTTRNTVEVTPSVDVFAINDHAQVVGGAHGHGALWNPITP